MNDILTEEETPARYTSGEQFVAVPFIPGMLCHETVAALGAWTGTYVTFPLDPDDDGDYARTFAAWTRTRMDLLVIEQDMVPTPGQIDEVLRCPEPWCQIRYDYPRTEPIASLGFCKIAGTVFSEHENFGDLASRDKRTKGGLVHWRSLAESVTAQLVRYGYSPHIHSGRVTHLHGQDLTHG